MASMGARELGGASAVDIYWVGSAADSKGLAVVMHLFYAMAGKVPMFIEGEKVLVEAGTGEVEVELPRPFGRIRLFYTGHPEPLTMPRYLSAVKRVTVREVWCLSGRTFLPGCWSGLPEDRLETWRDSLS